MFSTEYFFEDDGIVYDEDGFAIDVADDGFDGNDVEMEDFNSNNRQ